MRNVSKYERKIRLKKGDKVIVLTGRSRGEVGKIDEIDYKTNRLYIADKNMVKRAQKPDMNSPEGGIIDVPAPIHVSNVMVIDEEGNPTRLGRRKNDDGKLVRYGKKTNKEIVDAPVMEK